MPEPTTPPEPPRATPRGAGRVTSVTITRDPDDRVVAGVCAGIARVVGVDPLVVRVATVAFALAGGAGIAMYLLAWTIAEDPDPSGARPAPTRITRRQTVAVGLVALGVLLLLRDLGLWLGDQLVFPVVLGTVGSALIWARSDEGDRARWSSFAARLPGAAEEDGDEGRRFPWRLVVGALLVAIGMTSVLATSNALLALRSVGVALATAVAGTALVLGPWAARLVRELTDERRERIRSEERAEVAAHLHDSVLQTLALIQRSPDNPRRMVALARSQERELRAWLYGRRDVTDEDETTLRGLLDAVLVQVEAAHELDVDLVVVGDARPDDDTRALVAAVREALHNAGRHAGVTDASVYLEVEPDRVTAFVRDRGAGFDPETVPPDRRGVADSIRGRVERHGGTARLVTTPGRGTEWELSVPRRDAGRESTAAATVDTTPDPTVDTTPDPTVDTTPDPTWPAPAAPVPPQEAP